ncbi:MAG: hypothetical protein H6667_11230 [Ardenticatenaceae bacterium]|nr:hypothetical protein [Ardenticatenaceae bacterium]
MSSYDYDNYGLEFPPLGLISIWFGVILIGITAVATLFIDSSHLWNNPFLASLQLGLVAFIFGSLLYLLLKAGENMKVAAVPLVINVGTLLIIRFVPFGNLWQELRFQGNLLRYEEVVELVESSALQPDADGYIALPFRYRNLTADGATIRLNVNDGVTRIFFYTSRTSPQSFSGYFYSSDNNPPQTDQFNGRWRYVVQKRPYWFYCSSY